MHRAGLYGRLKIFLPWEKSNFHSIGQEFSVGELDRGSAGRGCSCERISAIGAGLFSIGVPKDSIIKYETQIKADKFVLVCHGTTEEVENARSILEKTEATEVNIHSGVLTGPPYKA